MSFIISISGFERCIFHRRFFIVDKLTHFSTFAHSNIRTRAIICFSWMLSVLCWWYWHWYEIAAQNLIWYHCTPLVHKSNSINRYFPAWFMVIKWKWIWQCARQTCCAWSVFWPSNLIHLIYEGTWFSHSNPCKVVALMRLVQISRFCSRMKCRVELIH